MGICLIKHLDIVKVSVSNNKTQNESPSFMKLKGNLTVTEGHISAIQPSFQIVHLFDLMAELYPVKGYNKESND